MSEPGREFMAWLRRPPTQPAGPEVAALFRKVAGDPRFRLVAGLSEQDMETLLTQLQSASFWYCNVLQGGYAGRPPERGLVLGLSRLHRRLAPAAHELFHLARDVRRKMSLAASRRWWENLLIWLEEVIVWMQTVQYLPLRGSAEFLGHGAIVGALILGAWRLSQWLFGP